MTTYSASAVSDSVIAHKKGITIQQGRALRDNPIAQMEGATGSPEIHTNWVPHDIVSGGDGEIWSFATDGAVGVIETPDLDARFEYRIFADSLTISDSNEYSIFGYRENDAAWVSLTPTALETYGLSLTTSGGRSTEFEIYNATTELRFHNYEFVHYIEDATQIGLTDTYTPVTVEKRIIFHSPDDYFSKLKLETKTAGSRTFTAGAVYLYRRLCYI